MRSTSLTTLVLFSSGAIAAQWNGVLPRALTARADQSFTPGETQGHGSTCKEAFGGGSRLCANSDVCYDPTIGDSCCSEGYPCPTGSFCLTKGLCCPNGVDPNTCATDNGITLPANFGKTTKAPATETSASAKVTSSSKASTSAKVTSSPASTSTVAPPFPIPGKTTVPAASGSGTISGGAGPTGTIVPFHGAASSVKSSGGLLGAILAVVGLMRIAL